MLSSRRQDLAAEFPERHDPVQLPPPPTERGDIIDAVRRWRIEAVGRKPK